jgi:hypothetical protein
MPNLADSLYQLVIALGELILALGALLVRYLPLAAWIAYWTFGVNWVRFRRVLLDGGWVGVVLLALVAILVWGTISPPASGTHSFLGLALNNLVGKTVLVTTLICIMFLCGSVQLSGFGGALLRLERQEALAELEAAQAAGHGHDGHAEPSHGHPAGSHH